MKLSGGGGPKFEAGIDVNGYVSAWLVRAGVRVSGSLAAASLNTEIGHRTSVNLGQKF